MSLERQFWSVVLEAIQSEISLYKTLKEHFAVRELVGNAGAVFTALDEIFLTLVKRGVKIFLFEHGYFFEYDDAYEASGRIINYWHELEGGERRVDRHSIIKIYLTFIGGNGVFYRTDEEDINNDLDVVSEWRTVGLRISQNLNNLLELEKVVKNFL